MSCCAPWIKCEICGEDFPIHQIEECCEKQVCEQCAKKCKEKVIEVRL
jgi:hypothetical protein